MAIEDIKLASTKEGFPFSRRTGPRSQVFSTKGLATQGLLLRTKGGVDSGIVGDLAALSSHSSAEETWRGALQESSLLVLCQIGSWVWRTDLAYNIVQFPREHHGPD